jgi:hypothetical protein
VPISSSMAAISFLSIENSVTGDYILCIYYNQAVDLKFSYRETG